MPKKKSDWVRAPNIPHVLVEHSIAGMLHVLNRLTGIRSNLTDDSFEDVLIFDCHTANRPKIFPSRRWKGLLVTITSNEKSKNNIHMLHEIQKYSFITHATLIPTSPDTWKLKLHVKL